ncbi:type I-E CRISPR-associated protein Cse2/CasB [Tuanshanicoccus lijuaniae]|uniref:type I-E CRISPR-associated protein Cse2/CasB n=1 Tax=Aerococcaceae bacterium zg-1292 TaxID=2774330 RepID=UPI001938237A|nr:type I-E CRISPR-associated protein Cse2/CasB [Aerococcaceae bacterium zg-1292]MBF6626148.1 type I-E CRISPR-associated protein Cse2/CasB [Aerococcaceae bacterium zg-BR9]MBF6978009.1 type I-E CRISPR-associated protein Cse2/CasB [Aerococcaceae bacterium zg-BR22]MBS4456033.1 type I-E CRISPR-associated protein Cse2/CasB [Aerococcaceae bacterium zg-A91]MBS4457785.1 type I-E CRISPR-associated protein Cse2/CasB [Aerococcaceae bacterium zg-BR33]
MKNNKPTVSGITYKILCKLTADLDVSNNKATIANLRNSIGKPLSQSVNIFPLIFDNFPHEFLGKNIDLTCEEKAILNTLQLFALYQQGNSESAFNRNRDSEFQINMGSSLSVLRIGDDVKAVDRRFNAMITAGTYEELIYHLRQMIKLLKSKTKLKKDVYINFPTLSNDLYWYLRGFEEQIRLKWAKTYYSTKVHSEGDNNND